MTDAVSEPPRGKPLTDLSQDLVSVVIPAYNAETYLRETLDSVLRQTYRPLEIIVVDDGSVDSTPKILSGYQQLVKVIQQPNAGVAAACNTGVEAACGEWIALLDADDLWAPEKIEYQMRACRDGVISYTDCICFGDHIKDVRRSSFEPPHSGQVLREVVVRNFITKSSVMVLRDVYRRYGGFPMDFDAVEDWPLWISVCAENEILYCPEPLVRYRVHRQSKSMKCRNTMRDHLRIISRSFGPGGVAEALPELKSKALSSSYSIHCHYAMETKDWNFALRCAAGALVWAPGNVAHWKNLLKAMLAQAGLRRDDT